MEGGERVGPIFRDIRRYTCQFCGTCRSKKSLLTSHLLSSHPEEMEKLREMEVEEEGQKGNINNNNNNTCGECGATFKKPAHLKQHMISHSDQDGGPPEKLRQEKPPTRTLLRFERHCNRQFVCPVDDCNASYRRKDHLNRHLLQHQGKLFKCPIEECNKEFAVQGNIKRHLKEFHEKKPAPVPDGEEQKKHVCKKAGCGKEFKYASQLQKHEESHTESSEAFCADPSCMKPFANRECLKAHMRSCHQYISCEVCGSKHLRKNYKRHLLSHEEHSSELLTCTFEGCSHSFTTISNLRQHEKAVHLNLRPFVCSIPGCGMSFAFKHVRDNHEKSGRHVYVHGDLEEFDEQWRSRPHGGQKRKYPFVEMLLRKRITPPNQCDTALAEGSEYLSWLLSADP